MSRKSVVRALVLWGRRWVWGACAGAAVLAVLLVSVVSLAIAAAPTFPDVPATHPYYAAISDLASRGIIGGYANGSFGPNDPVTRQQFAKMIVLAGGYYVSERDVCPFTDVDSSGPSSLYPDNYVAVCAAKGITTGKTPTTFDPTGKITRYQVVTMVVRMAGDLKAGLLAIPPASWNGNAKWAANPTHGANAAQAEYNGLLAGLGLAALDPLGNMSRGEVAQVLHNLLGKITQLSTLGVLRSTDHGATWTDLGNAFIPDSDRVRAADPTPLVIDGKIVLFFEDLRSPPFIYRADSTNGVDFAQPVIVFEHAGGMTDPFVLRLADGSYRIYTPALDVSVGIISATSQDGFHFTQDPGVRQGGGMPGALLLPDGRIRLFSGGAPGEGIRSAVSDDGLDFTPEPGARIPAGTNEIADNPEPIRLANGSFLMLYQIHDARQDATDHKPWEITRMYLATSKDGFSWTTDSKMIAYGGTSCVVEATDGTLYIYYVDRD